VNYNRTMATPLTQLAGKTSCIMVLCAATLADFSQLVRIIVPKPLLLQTAQLLQSRLCGLIGRSVTHLPWSRRTSTNERTLELYRELHRQIQGSGGVLLSLAEDMLSFRLSG
jgi:hypothetical protein